MFKLKTWKNYEEPISQHLILNLEHTFSEYFSNKNFMTLDTKYNISFFTIPSNLLLISSSFLSLYLKTSIK